MPPKKPRQPETPKRPTSNITSEIKRLVAVKRKARSTWQKNHTPDSRRLFNQAINKLKSALHEMRNASFTNYISHIKRDDNSIWKPIKKQEKTTNTILSNTQILDTAGTMGQKRQRKSRPLRRTPIGSIHSTQQWPGSRSGTGPSNTHTTTRTP